MKAINIERYGRPEVLKVAHIATPQPGPGQVLIRAHAIGVGMPDILVRSGRYPWSPPLPIIPGIEMSGRISALGEGVSSLKVGDPVLVSSRELAIRGGCYAEMICADAAAVYRLPDSINLDDAACLSNYQVAWHVLHTALNGFHYESVLVWAAAGGVGTALVQLAKLEGKTVFGIVSGPEKCAFALKQGADACIDRKSEDVAQRLHSLTHGRGVDLVLDCVGGQSFARNIRYLAALGMALNFGLLEGPPDPAFAHELNARLTDSLAVRLFSMHVLDHNREKRRSGMEAVIRLLERRSIRPHIHQRLSLEEARRAHEMLEGGNVLGKLLLKP